MGLSLAQALLRSKHTELLIYERDANRHQILNQELGKPVFLEIDQSIKQADIILLCIKPQDFKQTAQTLRNLLTPKQLIISILAGTSINRLSDELAHKRLIRCMPNMALQVGCAVTVIFAANCTANDLAVTQEIFSSCGTTLALDKEDLIDAATALSGSGPAYFYYLSEGMLAAGKKLGFSEDQAMQLVRQTFLGSAKLLDTNHASPKALREMVTSKGGTTEAALKQFKDSGFEAMVIAAIEAAFRRAKELSK